MTTITLQVPDSLGEYQSDTIRFIASKLYESGKLSLGQAADMAGLTKRTFAELLSDYGVSYINYSVEDLKDELRRNSGL
jgi:predicted HTH domain antitoxin